MQRFFVSAEAPEVIDGDEHKHLSRSLRMQAGEQVEVLDGKRVLLAEILSVEKTETHLRILREMPSREAQIRMTLYVGLLKGEKLEWVVQKGTELGVHAICVVPTVRSMFRDVKYERLERIAREAQKQCGRARVASVYESMSIKAAIEDMRKHEAVFVAYEGGGESLPSAGGLRDVGLVIGPEGGFDEGEIGMLREAGARVITLGPRILRAETAAIAALAALMAGAGEWE